MVEETTSWTKRMLSDVHGDVSSKRVITLATAILVFLAFTISIFKQTNLTEYMWVGMVQVLMAGLGVTALEKFSVKTYRHEHVQRRDDSLIDETVEERSQIVDTDPQPGY